MDRAFDGGRQSFPRSRNVLGKGHSSVSTVLLYLCFFIRILREAFQGSQVFLQQKKDSVLSWVMSVATKA
jgi:hypothetical protein